MASRPMVARRAVEDGADTSVDARSLAETRDDTQLGGEAVGQETDRAVRDQSRQEGVHGQGDLLRNLAPVEPMDFLVNVGQQAIGEGLGLRRVEVTRREGSEVENQGALGGPVHGVHPLTYPQGRPAMLGPPVMPPFPGPMPGYPLGVEYPPVPFDPMMAMRPPQYGGNWFGTPVRPLEWGTANGNPFWSPEARRALENVESGRTPQVPRALDSALERTEGVNRNGQPPVEGEGSVRREPPTQEVGDGDRGARSSMEPQLNPLHPRLPSGGTGTPYGPRPVDDPGVVMDPVELFRIRCLREAEQKFLQGIEKFRMETQQNQEGSNRSYVSIPNQGEGTPQEQGNGSGNQPPGLTGKRESGKGNPQETPKDPFGESVSESLRSLELPKLNENASALVFGDWLAVVEPLMADIGNTSSVWWQIIMQTVQESYEKWLTDGPLDRLRRTVDIPKRALAWPRTEKRAVTMLLQSLPDRLKTEMVSSRRLTTPQIMFRLFCLFQPGGQSERSTLLQLLTDFKLGSVLNEHAGSLRQWIRWLERGEELGIVLPDPMILSGVMGRASDVVGKTGAQVGFRLASARQQLQLDNRPSMPDVKLFAEYVLAEAEELVVSNGSSSSQGNQGGSKPAVKMVSVEGTPPKDPGRELIRENGNEGRVLQPGNVENVTSKTPCKFWLTDEGCKKGEKCRFTHTVLSPKDNRCFNCSGVGHGKRECPVGVRKKVAKTVPEKPSRKPETGDKRGQKPDGDKPKSTEGGNSGSVGETKTETPNGPNKAPEGSKDGLGELLREASCLMKALRPSLKAVVLKLPQCCKAEVSSCPTGLLDGGATNVLRRGSPSEIKESDVVTVELASGTVQLYQHRITGSILTQQDVEPIVPLRGVVSLGYKIRWDRNGCIIHHPTKGKLACWLRNGCPVIRESHALQLIADIERQEAGKALEPRVASGQVQEKIGSWWKNHYPEIPKEVVEYMKGQFDGKPPGENLPWNRHVRRRVERAKALVIHLFSGPKDQFWKRDWPEGVEVLTVDSRADPRQNLHDPVVWAYLVHLVTTKRILGLVGGPPCRSVSRLRHNGPGPRPVRGRGPRRFGLENLSESETQLVHGDGALFLKQLSLYDLAKESEINGGVMVGFLLESPEDPLSYDDRIPDCPSFWDWEELKEFQRNHQLDLISFDQGIVGHPQKKPTSCMTNLGMVLELNNQRVAGKRGSGLKKELHERFEQTASWSAWALELKVRIKVSLMSIAAECGWEIPKLRKILDREGWKLHISQGHRPFRRDCRACILDMASGPPHRRRVNSGSSAWSMGIDVVQMTKTKDPVSGLDVKYVVVATALVPFFESFHKDPLPTETPDLVESEDWGEGLDEKEFPLGLEDEEKSNVEPIVGPDEPPVDDANGELDRKVDDCAKPLKLKHLTLVEPVGSRQAGEILGALSLLLTRFRSMGVCVNRLHGDRAKELLSHKIQRWCTRNNLICTLGGGDDPANNGHVESEIGQLKRRLRLELRQAEHTVEEWPQALRWVAEDRLRHQLEVFGIPRVKTIPYNASVVVKRKRWHDAGVLAPPYVNARVLAPDPKMFDGWVVKC